MIQFFTQAGGYASVANIYLVKGPRDKNTRLYKYVDVLIMSNEGVHIELQDSNACTL
jgi:hypothetical protein